HERDAAVRRRYQNHVGALEGVRRGEQIVNLQCGSIAADENELLTTARAQRGVERVQPFSEIAFALRFYPCRAGEQSLGPRNILRAGRRDDELAGPLSRILQRALEERRGDGERPRGAERPGEPLLAVPERGAPAEQDEDRGGRAIHGFPGTVEQARGCPHIMRPPHPSAWLRALPSSGESAGRAASRRDAYSYPASMARSNALQLSMSIWASGGCSSRSLFSRCAAVMAELFTIPARHRI